MINLKILNKVSGKNIKISENFSLYCKNKFSAILNKYAAKVISYNASIVKKKYYFKVKLNVVLIQNIGYEATGKSKLPYEALNLAIYNLKKILRRHSRKLKHENKGNKQIKLFKESFFEFNNSYDGNTSTKIS